jgi:hypothetical protein
MVNKRYACRRAVRSTTAPSAVDAHARNMTSLFNRRAYGSENLRPMPKNIGGCAAAEIDFILISDSQFQ